MSDVAAPTTMRRYRWLGAFIPGAFLCVLAIGALLPVYSDEIGWRFQERAGIDGVDKGYSDICGPGTLARPPWFMMPVRWFSAATNQALADPLFVRLEGVACAFAWIALVWILIARLERDDVKRRGVRTLVFALLGMGTLPFLLVMSRPEQPLILTLTLATLIALSPQGNAARTAVKCAAILVLAGIALSYHLKGVAYVLVPIACLVVCARGRKTVAPRILAVGVLVAATAAAASYWVGRFRCPGDPLLAKMLAEENLAAAISSGARLPDIVLLAMKEANPLNYAALAALKNNSMSFWIPANLFPSAVPRVSVGVLVLVWESAILLALMALVRFFVRERHRAFGEPRVLVALAMLASVLAWGASQVNRNVYEVAHVLPVLALFVAICLTLPGERPKWLACPLRLLIPCAAVAALLSQAALLTFTAHFLLAAAGKPGVPPKQKFSVSVADYGAVRADIARAMTRAGIDDSVRHRNLMVDDLTYLALQRHLMPLHRLGVVGPWRGSIDDPARYLVSRRSAGIVTACKGLPDDLQMVAARSGDICAISGERLKELVSRPRAPGDG